MKTKNSSFRKIAAVLFIAASSFTAQAQNTFPSTGNVGIGINPAVYPLHVISKKGYGIVIEGSEPQWSGMVIRSTSSSSKPYYQYETSSGKLAYSYMTAEGDWKLSLGDHLTTVDRFTVANNGTVSIGVGCKISDLGHIGLGVVPSNGDLLSVSGNMSIVAAANVGSPIPGASHAMLNIGAFNIYANGSNAGNNFFIQKGNSKSIVIADNGFVGIGTLNPLSTFSVNGTITADELIVQEVGADYVFDEQYKLKSLSEVEAFIKTNKHLPGIAPAAETEKGIKVGEFNEKLLEKIEELTLYVIEANKEMNVMKAKIEKLESSKSN
jgi:hypothetical protein